MHRARGLIRERPGALVPNGHLPGLVLADCHFDLSPLPTEQFAVSEIRWSETRRARRAAVCYVASRAIVRPDQDRSKPQ
jgi:hypothetical protein